MKPYDDKWIMYDRRGNASHHSRKFSDSKFEPGIVDESAYMALDEDTKKKYIILNPTAEPFSIQSLTGLDHFLPSKDSLGLTVMPANMHYNRGGGFQKGRGGGRYRGGYNNSYGGGNYHHQGNQRQDNSYKGHHSNHQNSSNMTHVSDIEREANYNFSDQQETQSFYPQQEQPAQATYQEPCVYDQHHMPPPQPVYQAMPQPQWSNQMVSYVPQQAAYPVAVPYGTSLNCQQFMPYGNYTIPPPVYHTNATQITQGEGDSMNIIREGELSSTSVNWKPQESHDSNGTDLPLSDIPTLQFFYNLGVRYFFASGVQRQLEALPSIVENLSLNENTTATASASAKPNTEAFKADQTPAPTNTPVTTKSMGSTYGPPGNRGNGNFRRPFSNRGDSRDNGRDNRDNGRDNGGYRGGNWNNRKEYKFNANAKNINKLETKSCSSLTHTQSQIVQTTGGPTITATNTGTLVRNSPNNDSAASTQYSPISPIHDPNAVQFQQPTEGVPQVQQVYYTSYPPQQSFVNPQQQGVTMTYHKYDGMWMMNEEGYMMPSQGGYQCSQSYSKFRKG